MVGSLWRLEGLVGLGLTVVLAQSFAEKDHNLKLAGFLGTVWAEGWPDKVDQRVEDPPIKGTAAGDQPVYALLHPGTSPTESGPGKDRAQASAGQEAQAA